MPRLSAICCVLALVSFSSAQSTPTSDPTAISFALKAVAALTGGNAVSDLTLTGNVTQIYGSDAETGTGTFRAKGLTKSRTDISLSNGVRIDVRSGSTGAWQQDTGKAVAYAGHNCLTDAAWFFPGLGSLGQTANGNVVFKYIGQEQHAGLNTQHIEVFQVSPEDTAGIVQALSLTDIYLDPNTFLPLAIATNTHADNNLATNIPVEIRFANYQPINGILVPFHFQKMFNGLVVLDVTLTNASFNTGLSDSLFTLQ